MDSASTPEEVKKEEIAESIIKKITKDKLIAMSLAELEMIETYVDNMAAFISKSKLF